MRPDGWSPSRRRGVAVGRAATSRDAVGVREDSECAVWESLSAEMDALKRHLSVRVRTARETVEALDRVNPRNNPSLEEIARFHELHARHERDFGHERNARAAEERARRARGLLAKRS